MHNYIDHTSAYLLHPMDFDAGVGHMAFDFAFRLSSKVTNWAFQGGILSREKF